MQLTTALSIYRPTNRQRLLTLAALMVIVVAVIDWWTKPYISLGFLYLFPIMIAGGFLTRTQIVSLAISCAILQELFSNLPTSDVWPRLILSSAGFIGTGLFISELLRNRRIVIEHLDEVERQIQARRQAEEQLQVLVDSSPAAIVTLDADGTILLANQAAEEMFAPKGPSLIGQRANSYLPALVSALQSRQTRSFRTTFQCKGQRSDGEIFLAGVWFSTYAASTGNRLAAIIVDLSDDLKDREDLNLDYLLKNARILMSAVSHEIRNLCGAALVVHRNLTRVEELRGNADFEALGTLIGGLEKLSSMELRTPDQSRSRIDITSVLDEFRVLIESAYHESQIEVAWQVDPDLPLVWADQYGLLQVFLNLAKNSRRAMEGVETRKLLLVNASVQKDCVTVRFEDTGVGVQNPDSLFRPFQSNAQATGLGLYVSRALMKSYGGDLAYEHRERGCCFAVSLQRASEEDTPNA